MSAHFLHASSSKIIINLHRCTCTQGGRDVNVENYIKYFFLIKIMHSQTSVDWFKYYTVCTSSSIPFTKPLMINSRCILSFFFLFCIPVTFGGEQWCDKLYLYRFYYDQYTAHCKARVVLDNHYMLFCVCNHLAQLIII